MSVHQAAKILDLLEYFARTQKPATLAQLSQDLGWPRSSTFSLLQALAERGFLYEPRARAGYYPSPRRLASSSNRRIGRSPDIGLILHASFISASTRLKSQPSIALATPAVLPCRFGSGPADVDTAHQNDTPQSTSV